MNQYKFLCSFALSLLFIGILNSQTDEVRIEIPGKSDFIYDGSRIQVESTNTMIGQYVGEEITSGLENTFLGREAGKKTSSGYQNTYLGTYSGANAQGSRNVFIGYNAGLNENRDDLLYISNSDTSDPLIYGDFKNGSVTINDYLKINKDLTVERSALVKSNLSVNGSHSAYSITVNSPLPSLTFYSSESQYSHRFYSHPSLDKFYLEDDEDNNVFEIKDGELRLPEYGGTGTTNLAIDNDGTLIKTSSTKVVFNLYDFAVRDDYSNYTRLQQGVYFEDGTVLSGIKALIKDNEAGNSGVHNTVFVGLYRMNKYSGDENTLLPIYRIDGVDTAMDFHEEFIKTTLSQSGSNIIDNDTYIYLIQIWYCDECSVSEVEILK